MGFGVMSVALKYSSLVFGALIAGAIAGSAPAHATTLLDDTFDSTPLGASQAPGVWYPDRQAPAGFATQFFDGDNRLALTLTALTQNPTTFYDTQGRKYDVSGANFMSVQIYVTSAMISDPNRIAGLWGTAVDGTHSISAFPIIEFTGGQFRGWDNGVWDPMGLPTGFAANQWYTMQIGLDTTTDKFLYTVDGQLLTTVDAFGSAQIVNAMLQGYNGLTSSNPSALTTGTDRTIFFDNLVVSSTPLPAALPLFLSGGGLLAFLARRRAKAKSNAAPAVA